MPTLDGQATEIAVCIENVLLVNRALLGQHPVVVISVELNHNSIASHTLFVGVSNRLQGTPNASVVPFNDHSRNEQRFGFWLTRELKVRGPATSPAGQRPFRWHARTSRATSSASTPSR